MNITGIHFTGWPAAIIAAAAALACVMALARAQEWAADRYEVTFSRRGLHVGRRWYGAASQVIRRDQAGADDPDRFAVIDWWQDGPADGGPLAGVWLWVARLDPEYLTFWDEDAEPFWAPAADFAPYAVRRFRPHLWRLGWLRLPWLTRYVLLPAFLEGGA